MSLRAGARHLATVWQHPTVCWKWIALRAGRVQPRGHRTYFCRRWLWQWHITPLHIARDNDYLEVGVCFGARTLCLLRHR